MITIRQRLFISFSFILFIIIFIIGVFFYTLYNLNEIHKSQKHRYDQIRRVEKLKEFNNSFSWVVLDVITDFEKINVVKKRLDKSDKLFKTLILQKKETINNSETSNEKQNLQMIFSHFETIEKLISLELYKLVLVAKSDESFSTFNKEFESVSFQIDKLLEEEIDYLQSRLDQTQKEREQFIDTIKVELVILLLFAFLLSFIVSSRITKQIKDKLDKLNKGVLQLFKDDENTIKVDIGENNELSEITNSLNSYLEKQGDIIHSREELLRNISHELKTPIAKGKFLLENLKNSKDKSEIEHINNVFIDIEELTSKLLQREKLNFAKVNASKFKVSSLILESLSKLSIDDESKIVLDIEDDFDIEGDKYYLTIALKNLIDNAMKYALEYPIVIETKDNKLYIKNIAEKLTSDLIYYIQPFTREPNQQLGHGLGLNIVNKILQMHDFKLDYTYDNPYNTFFIVFKCQESVNKTYI
ncbi:ATP-binding protein [Arcobacter sp. YIC-464]|uniref:ATP-binding protein n=1 Tax=Arcobacter sp. YIC-464 TaxID=3376631 RepID=UPI003C1EAF19